MSSRTSNLSLIHISLKPEGTSPVVRAFIENRLFNEAQPTTTPFMLGDCDGDGKVDVNDATYFIPLYSASAFTNTLVASLAALKGITTVSYTHLDVYKRQVHDNREPYQLNCHSKDICEVFVLTGS